MAKGDSQKKQDYFEKVHSLFRSYKRIFVVNVDNVSSSQMHQIRSSLREKAVVLMGKNTMVRKAMRDVYADVPEAEYLTPLIRGNIGLVFTNGDLKQVRDILVSNKVKAAAKVGLIAQDDISIPAGSTGMDPNKTSFFQALGITTKVVKGAIEIVSEQVVVKAGQKVGASEAALLNMLNLMPFSFGMTVEQVYDNGSIFSPSMLDITDDVVQGLVRGSLDRVAALSLHLGIPTMAAVSHLMAKTVQDVLAVGLAEEGISYPLLEEVRKRLAAGPAVVAAPAAVATKAAPAAAVAAKKEESEEELGLDLFA